MSGVAMTTQGGVNGSLRRIVENPVLTALISFSVGTIALFILSFGLALATGQTTSFAEHFKDTNWWMWTGGLLGAFCVFSNIVALPKIGFANMFSLVVAGQVILALIFDQYGFFGYTVHLINWVRVLGVMLLIAGVYLIQKF
jgi:transporter family-2 protein